MLILARILSATITHNPNLRRNRIIYSKENVGESSPLEWDIGEWALKEFKDKAWEDIIKEQQVYRAHHFKVGLRLGTGSENLQPAARLEIVPSRRRKSSIFDEGAPSESKQSIWRPPNSI